MPYQSTQIRSKDLAIHRRYQGLAEEMGGELVFNGDTASVWEDETVLETMVVMTHDNLNLLNATEPCT